MAYQRNNKPWCSYTQSLIRD